MDDKLASRRVDAHHSKERVEAHVIRRGMRSSRAEVVAPVASITVTRVTVFRTKPVRIE
jgi:hypothetical protein